MIDCGADWLKALASVSPTAIVITHAHPDHAFGLARGASCPVYATDETWSRISRFPVAERRVVEPRVPFSIGAASFEAFPVDHSIRAPAVGYRVRGDGAAFVYIPDLAAIRHQSEALGGVTIRRHRHAVDGAPPRPRIDRARADRRPARLVCGE